MIKKSLRTFVFGLISATLVACGGGGGGGANFDGGPVSDPGTGTPTTGSGTGTGTIDDPVYSIGNGSGPSFTPGVLTTSQSALDAGESATIRVNIVDQNNSPAAETLTVTFSSPCESGGLASISDVVQVGQGLYSAEYTATGCNGEDIVTALLGVNGATASVTLTVEAPEVLSVSFVASSVQQLSLAGIGGNESTELVFKVAGPQDVAIIGEEVSFSINTSVGGASILAGRTTATTDNNGLARTILNSGTVAGPVNVLATHTATGRQGLSDDIIISTGVPEASRFSLSASVFNPPNAFDTDGIEVTISIIASDQFGNNPTDGTRISFVAPESGNIQSSCQLENGACSVTWRSTSPRPADHRLEILAYTDGAEDFVDNNGNSVFDASDGAIIDLSEPFADENESGGYNLGEFFFDTNHDGVRNSGNGKWDGPCLDKVDSAAVCTGESTVAIFQTLTIVMSTDTPRITSLGTFPTPGTTLTLAQGTSLSFANLTLADSNTNANSLGGNPLPFGTTVTFSVDGGGATINGLASTTIQSTTSPVGLFGTTVGADAVDPVDPLPTNVQLILTITVPSGDIFQYSWPLDITR